MVTVLVPTYHTGVTDAVVDKIIAEAVVPWHSINGLLTELDIVGALGAGLIVTVNVKALPARLLVQPVTIEESDITYILVVGVPVGGA